MVFYIFGTKRRKRQLKSLQLLEKLNAENKYVSSYNFNIPALKDIYRHNVNDIWYLSTEFQRLDNIACCIFNVFVGSESPTDSVIKEFIDVCINGKKKNIIIDVDKYVHGTLANLNIKFRMVNKLNKYKYRFIIASEYIVAIVNNYLVFKYTIDLLKDKSEFMNYMYSDIITMNMFDDYKDFINELYINTCAYISTTLI